MRLTRRNHEILSCINMYQRDSESWNSLTRVKSLIRLREYNH